MQDIEFYLTNPHCMSICTRLALLCVSCIVLSVTDIPQPKSEGKYIPLINGYAHNDYWHKRPLLDALENGYTNIEVDIFHVGNEFIVAHLFPFFRQGKTLENLYLKPLYEHIVKKNGVVYANYQQPIILMIDIKMNGDRTYQAMKKLLGKYSPILTSYENGIIVQRQVTIVLSGSKPYKSVKSESKRFVFIDEDLKTIAHNGYQNSVSPVASCNYGSLLNWNGYGLMPASEKEKLLSFVNVAHEQGKKVRLWASPEKEEVWRELLACGVDLINTDNLVRLRKFLLAYHTPTEKMQTLHNTVAQITAK